MSGTIDFNLVATPPPLDAGSVFVPANPQPALQGYQTGPQATFEASVSHANQVGSAFTTLPANATYAHNNINELGALATLSADALAGTVPAADVSYFVNTHQPIAFIAQNTVQVGVPPNTWEYTAPTPFIIPNSNALANQGYSASAADWATVVGTVATVGAIGLAASPEPVPAAIAAAGALLTGGASGAFGRVSADLAQGMNIDLYDQQHGLASTPGF
jgi:hypothetical protein